MTISRSDFLQRIMKYCAEAERSTHDVLTKLVSWGIPLEETEIILAKLRAEKFLDDNRYANSYVTEKWNLDRWGKIKIAHALHQKNLDEKIIEEALNRIDFHDYVLGLHDMLRKKLKEVKSDDRMEDAKRVMMFAMSRGFEEELILEWLGKEGFDV
jgi:regulatory protein